MKDSDLVFDIETGPDLDGVPEPNFEAPKNYKDPEKIAANIEEQRQKWREDAALSALTGRVLVIGVCFPETVHLLASENEEDVLQGFFDRIQDLKLNHGRLIGWDSHRFDLPFICRRALKHGIMIPQEFRPRAGRRFYWPDWCVDLREIWAWGEYPMPHGSLDTVSRSLLGTGKLDGVTGADFAGLWENLDTRPKALAYLDRDLKLIAGLAERMLG